MTSQNSSGDTAKLTLKVGCYYKNREGKIVGPLKENLDDYPYTFTDDEDTWTPSGRYNEGGINTHLDLVEELPQAEYKGYSASLDENNEYQIYVRTDKGTIHLTLPSNVSPTDFRDHIFNKLPHLIHSSPREKILAEGGTEFSTGAVRSADATGVRYDLITPIGLRRVAETYKEGYDKYGAFNWEKGMPINDILNHGIRHIYEYLSGDRSEDHLAHAAWNLLAAMHMEETHPDLTTELRCTQQLK